MKKLIIMSLLISNLCFAENSNELEKTMTDLHYIPTNLTSENGDVQIKYMKPKLVNENDLGFIDEIVVCNDITCRVFNYKFKEVNIVESAPLYKSFHAKLNNDNFTDGFICDEHNYSCQSYVVFDVRNKNVDDYEQKFFLKVTKKPINIHQKVKQSLFD